LPNVAACADAATVITMPDAVAAMRSLRENMGRPPVATQICVMIVGSMKALRAGYPDARCQGKRNSSTS
jgi:hypothetical protein